jgi:hypothetical protein
MEKVYAYRVIGANPKERGFVEDQGLDGLIKSRLIS